MIFLFGMVIGIAYGIIRYLCKRSFRKAVMVICGMVMLAAIGAACMSDDAVVIATIVGVGAMLALVIGLVCADAEAVVGDKRRYEQAVNEQKAQDKYDNEWGYITSKK